MLTNTDSKYRFAINNSQDFITLINRKYIYEIVNDSYCRVLNKKRNEILGRHVADIWGKRAFNSILKKYLDQCFAGKTIHYNERFRIGSSTKFVHASYYPYKHKNRITHVLVFSRDMTDQKAIESKLMNYEFRDQTHLIRRMPVIIRIDGRAFHTLTKAMKLDRPFDEKFNT